MESHNLIVCDNRPTFFDITNDIPTNNPNNRILYQLLFLVNLPSNISRFVASQGYFSLLLAFSHQQKALISRPTLDGRTDIFNI